jgi:hypothetical protein
MGKSVAGKESVVWDIKKCYRTLGQARYNLFINKYESH